MSQTNEEKDEEHQQKQQQNQNEKKKIAMTPDGKPVKDRYPVGGTFTYEGKIRLNRRLEISGFKNMGRLHAFAAGKFPARFVEGDAEQDDHTGENQQSTGLVTAYTKTLEPGFWKRVDRSKMLNYYLKNRKYTLRYARSLVNYFLKHCDTFFGDKPDEVIFKYTNHKGGWILNAMRKFGLYWTYEYNDDEPDTQVHRFIKRYQQLPCRSRTQNRRQILQRQPGHQRPRRLPMLLLSHFRL